MTADPLFLQLYLGHGHTSCNCHDCECQGTKVSLLQKEAGHLFMANLMKDYSPSGLPKEK